MAKKTDDPEIRVSEDGVLQGTRDIITAKEKSSPKVLLQLGNLSCFFRPHQNLQHFF